MKTLCLGTAEGDIIKLEVPLSFWGGFDTAAGTIIDRSHPACGERITGKILAMPSGRGSSSSSSILAEALREQTAPAGIILAETDPILTVGVIVAERLYQKSLPIVVCSSEEFAALPQAGRICIIAESAETPRVQLVPCR
jgi:predicted aconitase with swiveling domain